MAPSSGEGGSGSAEADPNGQTAVPAHPATEAASPHQRTVTGAYGPASPGGQPEPGTDRTVTMGGPAGGGTAGIAQFGPGVPAAPPPGQPGQPNQPGQPGLTADQVWRTGQLPERPRPSRRPRLRRALSGALTAALLVAAGAVLYLRFHHAPLRVTGVAITGKVANGCAVDVTGRIATNGAAGTVSYQWLFQPQSSAPQPLSQSVVAGQDAVYVTLTVSGQGRGSAAQDVTLQVLGPGTGTASAHVAVSC